MNAHVHAVQASALLPSRGPQHSAPYASWQADTRGGVCRQAVPVQLATNPLTAPEPRPAQPQDDTGWLWTNKASSTRARLAQYDAKPKRSLAQNFVVDETLLERVVAQAGIEPGDHVLEIGPGTGNLTSALLRVRHTACLVPIKATAGTSSENARRPL